MCRGILIFADLMRLGKSPGDNSQALHDAYADMYSVTMMQP
jgi:hypothetical protein